jgi:hypothetical protein
MNFSMIAVVVGEDFHPDSDIAPNPYTAQEDWSLAVIVLVIVAILPILAHRTKARRQKDKAKRESERGSAGLVNNRSSPAESRKAS